MTRYWGTRLNADPRMWGEDHLLVAAVVVLDDGGHLSLLVLLGVGLRLASRPGAAGSVPGLSQGRALLAALVGPEGLLDDLGRLVELPLLLVRQGQVGEILFTLGRRLILENRFRFLLFFGQFLAVNSILVLISNENECPWPQI